MGTGPFLGVECGQGMTLTPHPLLVLKSKNRVELYLYLRAFVACKKGETYLYFLFLSSLGGTCIFCISANKHSSKSATLVVICFMLNLLVPVMNGNDGTCAEAGISLRTLPPPVQIVHTFSSVMISSVA
jgi:hypothetical protein